MQSRWKCFSQSPCRETFLKMLFLLRESYFILILQIWFMNSTNFMLWREKASTIRKGKLFKFCFSTDNHLIVGMGKFFAFSDFINKILSRINTKSNNSDTHSLWAINESVTLGHLNDDVFRWNLKMIRQLTFF